MTVVWPGNVTRVPSGTGGTELVVISPVLSIAGCLGPIADLYPPHPQTPERLVWVVDHGWHTSLVVRTADVTRRSAGTL